MHRRTEYEELISRHGTRQHAEFFLGERKRTITEVIERHELAVAARQTITAVVPVEWRRAEVERADLHRFVFGPEDVVVVVGQDGLVANVAKYLDGQPVVGINPEPTRNAGVLVTHPPEAAEALLAAATDPAPALTGLTMVEAMTDDHQVLHALNEVYVGHPTHQSSRYRIDLTDGASEHQSSSGVLVGTGTGATGWLRSAWQERRSSLILPGRSDKALCWFVREAWPSPATGTALTEGVLTGSEEVSLVSESDHLVCFGDGIEQDALALTWGQRLTVRVAAMCLNLVG